MNLKEICLQMFLKKLCLCSQQWLKDITISYIIYMQGRHRTRRFKRINIGTGDGSKLFRLAKKNRRDISQLKSNHDWKFKDTAVDDAVVSAIGTVQNQVFVIGDGDTANQKDGLKITIKKVSCRFQFNLPTSADINATADILRIMLLKDKQANSALPAVLDILTDADVQAFREPPNKRRFSVLIDKTIHLNAVAGSGDGTTNKTFEHTLAWNYHKFMNFPIYYNNSVSTGAIAQINSNNLVMLYISEAGLCGVRCNLRVEYTD